MAAKLYYNTNNHSLRHIRTYLNENNIVHATQCLKTESLSWEQLLEILTTTENGIDDLLSLRSIDYAELIAQGVDFDVLTLTQFHELVVEYPKLIRSPILVAKNTTLIGYNEEEMSLLKNREDRKNEYKKILSVIQSNDVNLLDDVQYAY